MGSSARMQMIYRLFRGRTRQATHEAAGQPAPCLGRAESTVPVLLDHTDPQLDYITQLAVQAAGADIGGISLAFQSKIWMPSRVGIQASMLARAGSLCGRALDEGGDPFEVADARNDPRFAHDPLVSEAPHYRHYAAIPLQGGHGHLQGALWVMSAATRTLDAAQVAQLRLMARIVVDMLELRYVDPVSGMFNRAVFIHHLQRLLDDCASGVVTVGLVDLIGFRQVNDLFRRETGDSVLRLTGRRLEGWAAGALLGHLGADQFAFALALPAGESDPRIDSLRMLLSQPFEVEPGCIHTLHARIGIRRQALPCDAVASDLLETADIAASSIREQRDASGVREYDAALIARTRLGYELCETIGGAERFGHLEVHYQPQVDIERGRLIGMEALVRWRHPVHGLVVPGLFVPHAESTGRIFELDMHVLDLVCQDLTSWRAQGLDVPPVALNFSRASLMHSQIFARLARVLDDTGIPGSLLEFEVTESLLLDSQPLLHQRVSALRALGVRVAVDDFGTGYSNLDALNSFPFDRLKADRQFVHGVATDARTAGVFVLIQGIAAVFDAELLCEGLEDEADLAWLAARGVHCVQGWYFSRAQPAPAIERVLARFQEAHMAPLSVPELRAMLA